MQKYYKKYDEMIIDLEYDEEQDIVKLNNTDKSDLISLFSLLKPSSLRSILNLHSFQTYVLDLHMHKYVYLP